jgi:hypothetical protein
MFREVIITAITDIPTLVNTFAGDVGFTVTGTSGSPILTPAGGESFQLSTATGTDGGGSFEILRWVNGTVTAQIYSPRLLVGAAFNSVAPTKVIMFGALTPQPYLAIVVAYGFNLYRHLYLGVMEAVGGYTGGEVVSGSQFPDYIQFSGSTASYRGYNTAHLFGNYQDRFDATHSGGVHVVHADNPTYPWRVFHQASQFTFTPSSTIDEKVVFGGFSDDVNDGYLARAKSSFAGANILSPINLYAGRLGNSITPIGRPPGIRLVRMDDIAPESTISIGSDDWECIPAFAKSELQSVPRDSGSNLGKLSAETSWHVGYAYKV